MTTQKAKQISPVSLAFLGDAIFALRVKERLVLEHDFKSAELTKRTNSTVNARAQARLFDALEPMFTEEEADVARRARNTKLNQKAKNADFLEYKKATALEALIGFLYASSQTERLDQIFETIFLQCQ